jgi:hypothetical protein
VAQPTEHRLKLGEVITSQFRRIIGYGNLAKLVIVFDTFSLAERYTTGRRAPRPHQGTIREGVVGAKVESGLASRRRVVTVRRPRVRVSRTATVVCATVLVASLPVVAGGAARRLEARAAVAASGTTAPLGLQSVVQRAIGASDGSFRVGRHGGVFVASGGGIATAFGSSGVRVSVPHGTVDLRLVSVGYGGRLTAVARSAPVGAGDVVRYPRRNVVEWYRNGPFGLEQGFTVNTRPQVGSGPLTVALSLGGPLVPKLASGGVVFVSATGAVLLRYGGLRALDASGRHLRSALAFSGRRLLVRVWDRGARYPLVIDPFFQQGSKLTGSDESGGAYFGVSVALSADANTALIGGPYDNNNAGAAWVFTRSGSSWNQQGAKLTASDETGGSEFGYSVALSADGNTALVGGPYDNPHTGAAWVFTRSGSTWSQQGAKLTGSGESNLKYGGQFGTSVALSSDGNTALIGGPTDHNEAGAVWVFTRSGSTWNQQGGKLTGGSEKGDAEFGFSVALSGGGKTALIGGYKDNGYQGAAWVFTHSGSGWNQQGGKLTGAGETSSGNFGFSVALSANGSTALIGARNSGSYGAAWVFTRSGSTWKQQAELTASGETLGGDLGYSGALSANGGTALIGEPDDHDFVGAAWVFTRSGSTWKQEAELTGGGETVQGDFGASAALSGDAKTALIAGDWDNNFAGAAWVFGTACGVLCNTTVTTPAPVVPPTKTTTPSPTGTTVTVTAGVPGTYTFDLSTATQTNVVSDIPKTELNVPLGDVTFKVTDSLGAILSHTFEVCTTPLPGPLITLAAIQALPNSCTGTTVPPSPKVLAPGESATATIDFTSKGTYEYLSTVGGAATGDAFAGMKGVLNVT